MAWAVHPEPDFKHPGLLSVLYRVPLTLGQLGMLAGTLTTLERGDIAGRVLSVKVSAPRLSTGSLRAS